MTSTPSTSFGKAFGPPFDHDDADIILRSSDMVDFHVYQGILSASSPFFKSMFSLPQPNTSAPSEKKISVIDFPENSRTIATILVNIYPFASSVEQDPESLDDIIDVLVAAKKYDMALLSQSLNLVLAASECVQDNPIAAFCAAYSRGLGEACRIAAKASLKWRMNLNNIADNLQTEYMNGPSFYQLYKFHRACSATAAQAVSGTDLGTWITKSHRTWWDLANKEGTCKCVTFRYTIPYSMTLPRTCQWIATILTMISLRVHTISCWSILVPRQSLVTNFLPHPTMWKRVIVVGLPYFACRSLVVSWEMRSKDVFRRLNWSCHSDTL